MSNTTDIYWDVDGQSLHTYAWNIETLGGDRDSVPPFRGENMATPYRPGRRHANKVPDQRPLTLLMWTRDTDQDGVQPSTHALRLEGHMTNRRTIKNLFWKDDGSQVALTKRWYEGGVVKSATAMVELTGTMAGSQSGPYLDRFAVELLLADPFFYRTLSPVTLAVGVGQSITNPGDGRTTGTGCSIVLNGPLTNPRITNNVSDPDVYVQLGASIATGDFVTLDLDNWTAFRDSDGVNLVGGITHSGLHQWMALFKGSNNLTLTVTSGSGNAVAAFAVPYL